MIIMKYTVYIILFALSALANSCGEATSAVDHSPQPPREVRTAAAEVIDFRETITGAGRLADREEIRLSFKTGGIVHRILVNEGDPIRQGQKLATLELDEIQAEYRKAELGEEKAKIDVENARLALRLAERDYRNAKGLYQDSVTTLEQLENAEVQLENARNQLDAVQKGLDLSRQNVDVAQYNLQYSTITAPHGGTVLRKLVEAGEIVGPGNPVLLMGAGARTKVLRIDVTDRHIFQLEQGAVAEVIFDAYPNEVFTGQVDELAAMANPMTGTFSVEVAVTPNQKRLLSGMIGQAKIPAATSLRLLRIPVDAMVQGDGQYVEVFVLDDGKARQHRLQVYKMEGESLLIREGLEPTDTVITSGVGYLTNGQRVQPLQ